MNMRKLGTIFVVVAMLLTAATPAVAAPPDNPVHNVNFATVGLPGGVSVTVDWSLVSPSGKTSSGSTTFTSPGPSADVKVSPTTEVTYSGFPASVTVDGSVYTLQSTNPASGFVMGSGTVTAVGTYVEEPPETTPPGDETTPPGDETTPPGDETTPPGDETTPPGDETTPPGDETTPPGDETTPPGDETTPPGDETTPPGDETTPPGDEASQPEEPVAQAAPEVEPLAVEYQPGPLELRAPADITAECNVVDGATCWVELGVPVVSGGVSPCVVTSNASGFFSLGSTEVVWTVTDVLGNSVSDSQVVTVSSRQRVLRDLYRQQYGLEAPDGGVFTQMITGQVHWQLYPN
jgi:hypothetical protein